MKTAKKPHKKAQKTKREERFSYSFSYDFKRINLNKAENNVTYFGLSESNNNNHRAALV